MRLIENVIVNPCKPCVVIHTPRSEGAHTLGAWISEPHTPASMSSRTDVHDRVWTRVKIEADPRIAI